MTLSLDPRRGLSGQRLNGVEKTLPLGSLKAGSTPTNIGDARILTIPARYGAFEPLDFNGIGRTQREAC